MHRHACGNCRGRGLNNDYKQNQCSYRLLGFVCFLCGYIGKTLGDVAGTGTEKDGTPTTIKKACYKTINTAIRREQRESNSVCFDYMSEREAAIPFEWDTEAQDYTKADETIKRLDLTDKQQEVLSYRLSGVSVYRIARILSTVEGAIWNRLARIRRKYISIIN